MIKRISELKALPLRFGIPPLSLSLSLVALVYSLLHELCPTRFGPQFHAKAILSSLPVLLILRIVGLSF
jgi:hypothetical protein